MSCSVQNTVPLRTYKQYEETLLLALIKEGDELAFQEIYNRYWENLFRYVYNRMHVREGSEEIVQEVFLALWNHRHSVHITSLSAYLFTASKHKLLNHMRSSKVKKTYAQEYATFIEHYIDNSNEDWQNLNDLEHAVEESLSSLPKKSQTIFRLSRQQHLSISRIADQLQISTKTVENHLSLALKHLRTTLGEFLSALIFLVSYFH